MFSKESRQLDWSGDDCKPRFGNRVEFFVVEGALW